MTSQHLISTVKEVLLLLDADLGDAYYQEVKAEKRDYQLDEAFEFRRDLVELSNKLRLVLVEKQLEGNSLIAYAKELAIPLVALRKKENHFLPIIIYQDRKGKTHALEVIENDSHEIALDGIDGDLLRDKNGQIIFFGAFKYKSLVSEEDDGEEGKAMSPVKRLIRVLGEERKDIIYVFIYATFVGIVSLTLPLGIQAIVELVSGGVVFSSIYVLISLIILGILVVGGLQIMQITLIEFIQRRIFTKAALEFAFRIPRMKMESLANLHTPELINRFFDVLTLQKGLPKLLGDLMSAVIQIIFGLILLSFYHPFFVFFGLVLVLTLILIFRLTGPKGLQSSIKESKYKYRVVYWLEEVARVLKSFKISGNTNLPNRNTEYNVNNYLINRKIHFGVLISQYGYIVLFKAVITAGLLIIGTTLVINREITLGQFVASEVIIILILNSVEKIITYLDVVYDMLTAVDKISHVTDLPLEKVGGIDLNQNNLDEGFIIEIKDMSYKYVGASKPALRNINLNIASGERICISGGNDSGKSTLTHTIAGLNRDYEGVITMNGYSLHDLDLTNLRDRLAKNVSQEDIFDGSILDNIAVGKPQVSTKAVVDAIEKVGLSDQINSMPDGLNTHVVSGGKGFSNSFVTRLILARCLVKKPNLLILNDYFNTFQIAEKERLIELAFHLDHCTLITVSNDLSVMKACDRVVVMDAGEITAIGTFDELLKNGKLNQLIKS